MTNKQTQIELNKIIADINAILVGNPLLIDFRPCVSQLNVFECDVVLKDGVCIDKNEPHPKDLIVERTIWACDHMIYTLKVHIDRLEEMIVSTPR